MTKETYNFIDPTIRSHPISVCSSVHILSLCKQIHIPVYPVGREQYLRFPVYIYISNMYTDKHTCIPSWERAASSSLFSYTYAYREKHLCTQLKGMYIQMSTFEYPVGHTHIQINLSEYPVGRIIYQYR